MTNATLHEDLYRDLSAVRATPITVCGAGALGGAVIDHLARMGFTQLRVIDDDRIDTHNLSTQLWSKQDLGAKKATVLSNMLYRAVGARVVAHVTRLDDTNAVKLLQTPAPSSQLVVDCFDNAPSRAAVTGATAQMGIPCLHLALGGDGDYGCGLWDDAYVIPAETVGVDGCDYPMARPLIALTAAAGAEAIVGRLLSGRQRGFEVTLRDIRITPVP